MLLTITYYSFYVYFVFHLKTFVKNYNGESELFGLFLNFFTLFAQLGHYVFLVFLGIAVFWWMPIIFYGWSLMFTLITGFIDKKINKYVLWFSGFIACPIL